MKIKIAQGLVTLILNNGETLTRTFDGRASIFYTKKFFSREKKYGKLYVGQGINCAKNFLRELNSTKLIEMDNHFVKYEDVKEFQVSEGTEITVDVEEWTHHD